MIFDYKEIFLVLIIIFGLAVAYAERPQDEVQSPPSLSYPLPPPFCPC